MMIKQFQWNLMDSKNKSILSNISTLFVRVQAKEIVKA